MLTTIRTITNSIEFDRLPVSFVDRQIPSIMASEITITAIFTNIINHHTKLDNKLMSRSIVFTVPNAINDNHASVIALVHNIESDDATISMTSTWTDALVTVVSGQDKTKVEDILAGLMKKALVFDEEPVSDTLMNTIQKFLEELLYVNV